MIRAENERWRALKHGSIWWANVPSPIGRRPVLVLTRDTVLGKMDGVTVAPLTRSDRNLSTEVQLTRSDGVLTPCVVSLDNIETISLSRLDRLITQLGKKKMQAVYDAIRVALQIPG